MLLRKFYERTLPPTGIYTLFTADNRINTWTDSLDDLVEQTHEREDRTDCYFGVASFLQAGGDFNGRTQDNVDQLKCFRLDLDAGEKKLKTQGPLKVYETQRDALAALVAFTKETGLLFSILVSSGEGLHVYYELDEPIIPEQWQPVAKKFQAFGKSHGLKIDSSVTSDHSRVLRPVGTLHPNGNRVAVIKETEKVYTLREFADAVGHTAEPKYDTSINDEVLVVQGPPKSITKVLLRCDAMRNAYEDQAHVEEPYWRAVIGVCKHTVEGLEAAHLMSSKHPSYDAEEVEDKFNRWETGPATCDTFSEFASAQCSACPHKGKIKSPVQLGAMNVEEVEKLPEEKKPQLPKPPADTGKPWDGCIPDGFGVETHKGQLALIHYMKVERENEDGETVSFTVHVPITYDIFWFGQWSDAYDSDDTAQVVIHKMDRNIKRNYLMEQTLVASRSDLTKFLASKGIHLTTDKRAVIAMEAYAKSSLLSIKSALQQPKITDRFGLRILEDGTLVAAQGPYVIHPNGKIEQAMLAKSLRGEAQHYHIPLPEIEGHSWPTTVWRDNIVPSAKAHVDFMRRFYLHPGFEKYQLAIMLGICSPLMAFVTDGYWKGSTLPANGLSLALYSKDGGKGKTTAMRCAQLAYGRPSGLNKDNDDLNTTANGRMARLSISGTMPVNMDEMGDMDAKQLALLVRTIANGSGKVRATKDGGLNIAAPWALTCLIGTNKSQREIIAQIRKESSAEQFRLLELNVDNMPIDPERQNEFEVQWKQMSNHAGALGAVLHLLICSQGVQAINDMVTARVSEAARMVQAVSAQSASRFQYRALGALLAAHDLLDARGLAPFPKEGLIAEFLRAYRQAVDFVDDNVSVLEPLHALSRALLELQQYTIITQTATRRNAQNQQYDQDIRGRPPLIAKARHVIEWGETFVSSDALKSWCHDNNLSEGTILMSAKQNDLLLRIYPGDGSEREGASTKRWASRFNLFKGMRENPGGAGVSCYRINVKRLGQLLGAELDMIPSPEEVARAEAQQSKVVSIKRSDTVAA